MISPSSQLRTVISHGCTVHHRSQKIPSSQSQPSVNALNSSKKPLLPSYHALNPVFGSARVGHTASSVGVTWSPLALHSTSLNHSALAPPTFILRVSLRLLLLASYTCSGVKWQAVSKPSPAPSGTASKSWLLHRQGTDIYLLKSRNLMAA